jgi:RNA polymerase sigma factor (sigma-70 family)
VTSDTSALATAELRHPRHELHRRLSDEQQRWLADLYRRNASAVNSLCRSVLRNRDDAADATQEVFLRAVDTLKQASSPENARSWLLTMARSYCLEVLQGHQRLVKEANVEVDSGVDADPEAAAIRRHVVTAIFGELRERERRALWQWVVERRPLAEIAHDQGRSYKAVQQLLIRARRHALSVAARVAALLGLFQFGRAAHRVTQAGQLVLVAVTVPLVITSLPSSNAIHRDQAAGAPQSTSVLLVRVPPATPTLPRNGGGNEGRVIEVSGVPVSVPSVPLKADTSAVKSTISTLRRAVDRTPLPLKGDGVLVVGSGPKVELPVTVGPINGITPAVPSQPIAKT